MKVMSFYNDVHVKLKQYINHYWLVSGNNPEVCSGELLPMDHIDMILTEVPVYDYVVNDNIVSSAAIHFHGIRLEPVIVNANLPFKAVGISFKPWGYYPYCQCSMDNFVQRVVDVSEVNQTLSEMLHKLDYTMSFSDMIHYIEEVLIDNLAVDDKTVEHMKLVEAFIENQSSLVSERHMNRLFKRYVGVSPKTYLGIRKFEDASRDILYNNENMTTVSVNNAYYDQSHFNREIKKYTYSSPKKLKENPEILKSKLHKDV